MVNFVKKTEKTEMEEQEKIRLAEEERAKQLHEETRRAISDYIDEETDWQNFVKRDVDKSLIDMLRDEKDEELLCKIIRKFPEIALYQDEKYHNFTIGHFAGLAYNIQHDSVLHEIIKVCPQAMLITDTDGCTFLHRVDTFSTIRFDKETEGRILEFMQSHPNILLIQGYEGNTLGHLWPTDWIIKFAKICPESLLVKNKYGNTIGHAVIEKASYKDTTALIELAKICPESLLVKNKKGNTIGHSLIKLYRDKTNTAVLIELAKICPKALTITDNDNRTIVGLAQEHLDKETYRILQLEQIKYNSQNAKKCPDEKRKAD